jgi:PAS domain S-box-containing protein
MEDIYKIILEETLAGYWDWDIKQDAVVLNPAFKAIFGYLDHELPGTSQAWYNLTVPEDRELLDNSLKQHFASRGQLPFNVEVRYLHKDGSVLWVNSTGRVIEWDGNEPVRMVGCHIDITKKKTAEHNLEISEQTFRDAFEYSSIGMVLVSTEGKFLKVNKSICELLGYTDEELITKTFQEITHPDDLEADLSLLQKTLNKEIKGYQMEKRYFTKSKNVIWILLNVSLVFNQDGEPLYFVSQIKDITQRKMAEAAQKESERRWIFASEGTGGGLWDWDLKNSTIFHSKQCLKMIGLEEHEFTGVTGEWTSRVHPEDKEKFIADVKAYVMGETEFYTNQHRVLCKDNTYKWILDRGKVIEYDEDNKPARIIGTHTDITEQKNKEEQLRLALDQLSGQNNRLLNFAYIISHNLRTHTSNFKMIMDYFTDPSTDPFEKEELADSLKKVSEQLHETITNLNEVVSIQTHLNIQTQDINLYTYVNNTLELMNKEISSLSIDVKNNIPADCIINYSPAYMESILLNFISNGIKYRSLTHKPFIAIDYFKDDNDRCGLVISDNGIGIDLKKYGDQLFGMYKTFNGNRDAKGMGLFITKNQVESLGGKIEVESEPGKGTTFKVYLN